MCTGWIQNKTHETSTSEPMIKGVDMNSDIPLRSKVTAVSSEAWAKLRDWASMAGRGWLLLSGRVAHASLKTVVVI